MPKPGEFLVGLLEFFAILLPGGIAVALVGPRVSGAILGPVIGAPQTDVERWALFLMASYVVGNMLFHVGSWLDPLYDRVRARRRTAAQAARAENPDAQLEGVLYDAWTNERVYREATALRQATMPASQHDAMNTLKWARSLLLAHMPAGAEDVHRVEADSKFFRSAVVVCAIAAVVFLLERQWVAAAVALLAIWPCFSIYFDRRMKCTTQAYTHALTLMAYPGISAAPRER